MNMYPQALASAVGYDPMMGQVYDNLLGALKGNTMDQYQKNRSVVDRGRTYQQGRDYTKGRFAAGGLGRSGVAQAADASLAANSARDADVIRRRFAAEAERRKRENLMAYSNLVMFPQINAQQAAWMQGLKDQADRLGISMDRWDQWAGLANAMGSVASAFQQPKGA